MRYLILFVSFLLVVNAESLGKCSWLGTGPACGYDCYYGYASKRFWAGKDALECKARFGHYSGLCDTIGKGCITGCYVYYCPDWTL
jgi:hypothetical protein